MGKSLVRIKKVMHFFWGNSQISWMRYMTLYSFRMLNPDWKMILFLVKPNGAITKTWLDTPTQDFHNFIGQDYFEKIKDLDIEIVNWELTDSFPGVNPATVGASHKSNFFKWNQLANISGFYCDLDVLFVKPIRILYLYCRESDVVIAHHSYYSIGLLGSSGNNNFFRDVYQHTFKNYDPKEYQSAGVQSIHGWSRELLRPDMEIYLSYRAFEKHYKELKFYNLDMSWIYPWLWNQMEKVFGERHIKLPDKCIGIHWYAGAAISQKYNNIMNESNFMKFENTYSHFAQKVLDKFKEIK